MTLFFPSPASAQVWQKVGTYPNGDPGFQYNLTDAGLYSLNGTLYAIVDDKWTQVEVYRLNGTTWEKTGGFGNSYTGAYFTGRAMTFYQNNIYAAMRHIDREIIRPNGDVTTQWRVTPPGSPSHASVLDEAILPPTPGDVSDYIRGRQGDVDRFTLENVTKGINSKQVIVYFYARGSRDFNYMYLNVYSGGLLIAAREPEIPANSVYAWREEVINVVLTPSELNALEVELIPRDAQRNYDVATLYVDIIYGGSLKTYRYAGGTTWNLLGNPNNACDTSGSAYFNCEGTGITGFTGYNGNLYVGTGVSSPPDPRVYQWNGSNWTQIADGSDLYYPPGGTGFGNIDLIEYNSKLYAGSREDVFITGYVSLYEYLGGGNWNRVARENTTLMGNFANARTLVPINGKLAVAGTAGAFSFDGTPTNAMPPIGQYPFGVSNRGMTNCGDYLYMGQTGQINPPGGSFYTQVWRIDATNPILWSKIGANFGTMPIYHGDHMIKALNEKIYVLTQDANGWAAVYEYTGSAGTCSPPVNGSISGLVWEDADLDGVIDGGENPVGSVQVFLTGTATANTLTTTGTPTNYSFVGLDAGTYNVRVSPPISYVTTVPASGQINGIVISAGNPNQTANFGIVRPGNVQGYIWLDTLDPPPACTKNGAEVNYTTPTSLSMVRTAAPVYTYNLTSTGGVGNNFSWAGIRPGIYDLSITTLPWPPVGYSQTTASSVQVTITPGVTTQTPVAGCL